VVLAGLVKLVRPGRHGREMIVALMGPGDEFGEAALFDPAPRSVTAVAVEDGRVARIDATALRREMARRPELADRLLQTAARRVRRSTEAVTELVVLDAAARVARRLLDLHERFGDRDAGVLHGLTQEELAQLVGVTRETVNKILGDFADQGWLRCEGRAVRVLLPDLLARRGGLPEAAPTRRRPAPGRWPVAHRGGSPVREPRSTASVQ
jgi:CRP-like cAMP-binding protein